MEIASTLLASPLVLTTPFVAFVGFHAYSMLRFEVLLCVLGLLTLGLLFSLWGILGGKTVQALLISIAITLFLDVQFEWFEQDGRLIFLCLGTVFAFSWITRAHVAEIVAATFLALLLSCLLFPSRAGPLQVAASPRSGAAAADLPIILHLVLDEHIGIEGIPIEVGPGTRVQRDLKRFYQDHGFRLFGRAYSRYYETDDSLANMFNFEPRQERRYFLEPGRPKRPVLAQNRYFVHMAREGYEIHVYQTDYMDFCRSRDVELASCRTYPIETIKAIETAPLPTGQKARFIAVMFSRLSHIYTIVKDFYNGVFRKTLKRFDLILPRWHHKVGRVSTLSAMSMLETLIADLSEASRGNLYFAHILLPHYPYAYDGQCRLRPSKPGWLRRTPPNGRNTPRSRALRYRHYFAQVTCLHRKLEELFDEVRAAGVYEDAIILIHGDHGSRIITVQDRVFRKKESLSANDYIDAFSTLFAAKGPAYEPGYDTHYWALDELLLPLAPRGIRTRRENTPASPYVYRVSREWRYEQSPLVEFGGTTGEGTQAVGDG